MNNDTDKDIEREELENKAQTESKAKLESKAQTEGKAEPESKARSEIKEESYKGIGKRKKKKWIGVAVTIAVIAAAVVFAIIKIKSARDKLMETLNGTTQEAQVVRMDIASTISATGTIQSKDVRTLTSPLSGVKIDEVNYEVGDMVEAGAVVVAFSREDINKKIGQIEEDITEANKTKNLDAGNRDYTYQNNYGNDFYNVASSYQNVERRAEDLQKAKDDYAKACEETGDYRRKYEEAKDKIGGKKEDLEDAQVEYKKWQDTMPDLTVEANIRKNLDFQNRISDLQSKVAEYESTIKSYDTGIDSYIRAEESAQSAVDNAQRLYDDAVVAQNKASYDSVYNTAKYDYSYNRDNVTANDGVTSLERQLEERIDSLDDYIVTAPISGLVTSVNAQEGNGYVATSGALMTIQAVDTLEVATQIDEYDINNVVMGQKVVIMTDATGDDELEGRVTFISPTATAAANGASTNTFEVKIDILKKDDRLRLGMSAKLNIIVDSHNGVLAVPYDAIEEKEGGAYVIYVVDEATGAESTVDNGTILVIGVDGEEKGAGSEQVPNQKSEGSPQSREIPVQVGLEGDYYTEVISTDIREGMTVLVSSKAGELGNDFDMFMGGGPR